MGPSMLKSLNKFLFLHGRFRRDVAWTLGVQLVILFLSTASAVVVARWLRPEGKGILALARLVPGMLGLFLKGGIGVANVYFIGSRRFTVRELTANSVLFAILGTVIATNLVGFMVVTGLLDQVVPGVPLKLFFLAMLALPLELLIGHIYTILQGLQRIATANIIGLVESGCAVMFTIIALVVLSWGVPGTLMASIAAGIIALAITALVLRKYGASLYPAWEWGVIHETLAFGLKGHLGNIIQFLNYRFDMFIVNYFLGPAAVGLYSTSVLLAELLWLLPHAVGFAIFPKAASATAEEMNKFTPPVFWATFILTLAGAVALAVGGKTIINLIYSSAFLPAYTPLLGLLPGAVLLGAGSVLTNEIAGRGYPNYNTVNAFLALITTVTFSILLIPRYGIFGAAIATSIAYTVNFLAAIVFYLVVSQSKLSLFFSSIKWWKQPSLIDKEIPF